MDVTVYETFKKKYTIEQLALNDKIWSLKF